MTIIKPMLASAVTDFEKLTFPKLLSPKLDGIRAIVQDGVVYSRSGKPIRSKTVQQLFGRQEYNNLDGELIYGHPTAKDCFQQSTSFVMSENIPEGMCESKISFYLFDLVLEESFLKRYSKVGHLVAISHSGTTGKFAIAKPPQIFLVPQIDVYSLDDTYSLENKYLEAGYEGVMLRNPDSLYKHGRATEKSQDLLKVKRFSDSEAIVLDFEELMHNANEAKKDVFGYQERSSSKEGLVGKNTLGALIVRDIHTGQEFSIGTGFSAAQRQEIWDNKKAWLGKLVKYKSFKVGEKDLPRFPVFLGERSPEDI